MPRPVGRQSVAPNQTRGGRDDGRPQQDMWLQRVHQAAVARGRCHHGGALRQTRGGRGWPTPAMNGAPALVLPLGRPTVGTTQRLGAAWSRGRLKRSRWLAALLPNGGERGGEEPPVPTRDGKEQRPWREFSLDLETKRVPRAAGSGNGVAGPRTGSRWRSRKKARCRKSARSWRPA